MLRPLNIGEVVEYSLKEDKKDPTIFILAIVDSLVHSQLMDLGMVYRYNPDAPKDSVAETRMEIGKQEIEFVRFGLKGFKNFKDKDGNDIPFKTVKNTVGNTDYQVASDETLKYIPRPAIAELAKEIDNLNKISVAERKN